MPNSKQQHGRHGEDLVVRHLQRMGYKILARNFRSRRGEIDIIAKHQQAIVFVEVKARRSQRYGNPKWTLTPAKQRKISMVALEYLKAHRSVQTRARFDVVTVQHNDDGPQVEVIPNAFELAYP